MIALSTRTPAKLNLGLEVLDRRSDGFHEINTVMVAIGIFDRLRIVAAPSLSFTGDVNADTGHENLAEIALSEFRNWAGGEPGAELRLKKRIPVAAGLGGASSDAAATLRLAKRLWRVHIPKTELHELAAKLGSDVPFFLRCGAALATGRGEKLEPLPPPSTTWFVVASPNIVLPHKTERLYGLLQPGNFTAGDHVGQVANVLRMGNFPSPELLANAFERPLSQLFPALREELTQMFHRAGAPFIALSGAGPSHYTAVADPFRAEHIAAKLRALLGSATDILACQTVVRPPSITVVASPAIEPAEPNSAIKR